MLKFIKSLLTCFKPLEAVWKPDRPKPAWPEIVDLMYDKSLSSFGDEVIQVGDKKIKTLEQEIIEIQAEIEAEQKRLVTLHGDVLRANLEYKRFVEGLLAKLELNDDGDRLLKYAQHANDILQEYRIRLQRQKIGVLATTMTECYKRLANKKNLIERIEMDEATLDFCYTTSEVYTEFWIDLRRRYFI